MPMTARKAARLRYGKARDGHTRLKGGDSGRNQDCGEDIAQELAACCGAKVLSHRPRHRAPILSRPKQRPYRISRTIGGRAMAALL